MGFRRKFDTRLIYIKLYFNNNNNKINTRKYVEKGKNPLKAPQHHFRRKPQRTYEPTNKYKKNKNMINSH